MKTINNNLPIIVIFGRANVGKSTLFNRLAEKHQALVSEIEGTTRDANQAPVTWLGQNFDLVDTGGILDLKYLTGKKIKTDDIEINVQKQSRRFLDLADLILFVVDARIGLTPHDRLLADYLKKNDDFKKKILLVANKADSMRYRSDAAEFNKFGLGEPLPVSAANGSGTGDLLDEIIKAINKKGKKPKNKESKEDKIGEEIIKVAIIGKPNVGKSSLVNAILGYERVIVSPVPHTTREPQNTELEYKDKRIAIIDTAGLTKKGHKSEGLEKYGMQKSLSALKRAQIALLVIDVSEPMTQQDSKIIEEIVDRQVSLIIIANKWDKIEERDTKKFTQLIYSEFPFVSYAPIQFVSASTGLKVNKILDLCLSITESRKTEISSNGLSKLLNKWVKIHRPPKGRGSKYPRVFALEQIKSNPPVFSVQIGSHDTLDSSYLRFLENRLREKFGLIGTPIKMTIIHGKKVHGKAEL